MKVLFSTVILVVVLNSCIQKDEKLKVLDFNKFEITVPKIWAEFKMKGIDSSVEGIVTGNNDTIWLNYGRDVQGFNESLKVHAMESKEHFDSINWLYMDEMIFSNNAVVEERQGVYLDEYYFMDSIDEKQAKIMLPKSIGNGAMGIHFQEINEIGERLTLYAKNLDSLNHYLLYNSFKTIKFK